MIAPLTDKLSFRQATLCNQWLHHWQTSYHLGKLHCLATYDCTIDRQAIIQASYTVLQPMIAPLTDKLSFRQATLSWNLWLHHWQTSYHSGKLHCLATYDCTIDRQAIIQASYTVLQPMIAPLTDKLSFRQATLSWNLWLHHWQTSYHSGKLHCLATYDCTFDRQAIIQASYTVLQPMIAPLTDKLSFRQATLSCNLWLHLWQTSYHSGKLHCLATYDCTFDRQAIIQACYTALQPVIAPLTDKLSFRQATMSCNSSCFLFHHTKCMLVLLFELLHKIYVCEYL